MLFTRKISDCIDAAKKYNNKKIGVSFMYDGKCRDKRDSIRTTLTYLKLLDKIRNHNLNASVMVDLDDIGFKFDSEFGLANKMKIIDKAKKYKIKADFEDVRISDLRLAKKVLKNKRFSYLDGSDGRFVYNVHRFAYRNYVDKKRFEFRIDERDKLDRHFPNYNVRMIYKFK